MIKSPCIYYCVLKNAVCQGCGRTLDEIDNWMTLSDEERLKVIQDSKERMSHGGAGTQQDADRGLKEEPRSNADGKEEAGRPDDVREAQG